MAKKIFIPTMEEIRQERLNLFEQAIGMQLKVKTNPFPDLIDTINGVDRKLNMVNGKDYGSFHVDLVELVDQ